MLKFQMLRQAEIPPIERTLEEPFGWGGGENGILQSGEPPIPRACESEACLAGNQAAPIRSPNGRGLPQSETSQKELQGPRYVGAWRQISFVFFFFSG